ncbi:MAG: ribulose phosphate epimerase, partial [Gammaproteobacteria bacterium]|nr:ribulose phosphate epimerase [Gammaproteobacteria bacterium]
MKRRDFLKQSFILGAAGLIAPVPKVYSAPADGYSGRLLVTLQVDGGWDVTSFCDPKMNVAGEQDINNWANTAEIQTAGNLSYAPFADNAAFFDKYYQDMLIINGVDA